jgi:hypothetical protein
MRRDQLEHAIQTACQIIERPEVIVVGSQAILGTFREDALPADATMIRGARFQHRRRRSRNVDAPGSVARSVGESAERQHGGAGRTAAGHRLVPG